MQARCQSRASNAGKYASCRCACTRNTTARTASGCRQQHQQCVSGSAGRASGGPQPKANRRHAQLVRVLVDAVALVPAGRLTPEHDRLGDIEGRGYAATQDPFEVGPPLLPVCFVSRQEFDVQPETDCSVWRNEFIDTSLFRGKREDVLPELVVGAEGTPPLCPVTAPRYIHRCVFLVFLFLSIFDHADHGAFSMVKNRGLGRSCGLLPPARAVGDVLSVNLRGRHFAVVLCGGCKHVCVSSLCTASEHNRHFQSNTIGFH
eukprot:3780992-Rhodomonas_salina.3